MELLKNNEIPIDKWNALISESSYSSAFQTPGFYNLFNAVPRLFSEVFAVAEENELVALCVVTLQIEQGIKGFFSRRGIIYGGPVLRNSNNQIQLEFLLTSLKLEYRRRIIYLEIRNLNDYGTLKNVFKELKWNYLPYINYLINFRSEKVVWDNLSSNRRRQIKKAFNNGIQITLASAIEEINELYSILEKHYREKVKKPLFPLEFFKVFYENHLGVIFLIKSENKIIGGSFCPIFDHKIIYDWYRIGLDHEYKNLYPSTVAAYAILNYACENKISQMDFMGAGRQDEKYGVRDFKSEFGGELVEYGRFTMIFDPFLYKLGDYTLKLIKKFKG